MKTKMIITGIIGFLWFCALSVWPCFSFEVNDAVGDTTGPDIINMIYKVENNALDIKLTFLQELCGTIINQDLLATIRVDIDQSLMTGFVGGGGLQPRFGVDYEIQISLLGFCPSGDEAYLKYWRHRSNPPYVELERVVVTLGNPLVDPNGSVFVVGNNATYGTNNHQVFLRLPLALFSNNFFPLCTDIMTLCVNQLFPCPLSLVRDLDRAYVNVVVIPYYFSEGVDQVPDQGMIDTSTVTVKDYYPIGPEDLVVTVSDPPDDCLAPPCINGEEFVGLSGYLHHDNNITFELKLETYSGDDTASYHLLLDLDDNAATGTLLVNGSETLGIDFIAQYENFDNPVGEANPLAGSLYFWMVNDFCPLIYMDYLANVWRSNPGYIWVTLPNEFLAPYLMSNQSGFIKAVAASFNTWPISYVDLVPNDGSLQVGLTAVADIKANSSDGPVSIPSGNSLSVTIELDPRIYAGYQADWWCVADAPFGWYYYDAGTEEWMPGFQVSYQGPLFELTPPSEVLNVSDLPIGGYTFYFGVDGNRNGNLDEPLYYDSVEMTITP
jgi:hypothetical protein